MTAPAIRPVAGAVLALALVVGLPACSSWHRASPTSTDATAEPWDHVRLVHADGRRMELWTARVVRDTLYGYSRPRWGATVPPTTAVPIDSVRVLEVRGTDTGRTTGLVAGLAGTGLVIVGVIFAGFILLLSQLQ